jgi:hypothetical protein
MVRTAECACGSLKVKVETEPMIVGACSCTQCQRRTGSVFSVSAYFPRHSVQVVSGVSKTFVRMGDSGRKAEIHFCPEGGSSVFWDSEALPEVRGVAVGCFADPSFPAPQRAAYIRSRHYWVNFPPGIESYETSSLATASSDQSQILSKAIK